ncbi:hypothetical protein H6P81_009473 [Aristolochia fimbriata]|uniref:Uncharacterized protein n=1 Tax=Aristolochia fimbriata TaxID=158543 RepID=A0AAV7EQG1_ARIFI|nr:hypothetical protein H6P81_009473 [Aristolochia fimbriata]
MGFLGFCLAGLGFMLIGAWEAVSLSVPSTSLTKKALPSCFTHLLAALLSFFAIVNSSISAIDSSHSSDHIGVPHQLQLIAVASLFLLYSLTGIVAAKFTHLLPLPSQILDLLALFGFGQEFLLFYLQRKDPDGLENRYYGLLLVPIAVCFASTTLAIKSPKSPYPRLGRAVGLVLQGTWLLQMGFSFYTNLITHGCSLREKSRGNYTVRCRGHANAHRSMAIATLQFNCHLAFLVILVVGVYWAFGSGDRESNSREYASYKPISEELRQFEGRGQFTLDSDDEDQIVVTENGTKEKVVIPVEGTNGFGPH